MTARSETIQIDIDDEQMSGTFLSPKSKVPGVLFVHGWGGSQERDLERAKGIAGLGCVCLTFDLRGHTGGTGIPLTRVTREDNLRDLLAAYDRLLAHPALDTSAIAVVGTSYGGYLASILTSLRPVRWLALRVPALYRDDQWHTPKRDLDKIDLRDYRSTLIRALTATGRCMPVRISPVTCCWLNPETDDYVPHATIMSYRAACQQTHSLTHRIIDGAPITP